MKGFVIAGTGSGSGKTTTSLGIMSWLSRRGYDVAPFKVGPDFIDPGHHAAITGTPSRNLDSWMLSYAMNRAIFNRGCRGRDVAVVEGVMGLFDGYSGVSEAGSTAQMAKWLHLPVILLVDARSMARSAAAIVKGFETFDPDLEFAGVIFNKTGSQRHYEYLKEAVEASCCMKCLGHLPRNQDLAMPERHLGLVTSDEHMISSTVVDTLVEMIDQYTDLGRLLDSLPEMALDDENSSEQGQVSKPGEDIGVSRETISMSEGEVSGSEDFPEPDEPVRIAVARDKAFCFYYPENLEFLEAQGARLVFFSPISGETLPRDIHGIYLGGGYPELFAAELSANTSMIQAVKSQSDQGMPIYGECGGFMYLCTHIVGMDGKTSWPMTGCFPFTAVMSQKMRSLGYREITLDADCVVGRKGDRLRGHEFHYSALEDPSLAGEGMERIYTASARAGQPMPLEGYCRKNTLGSYMHIHFGSHSGAAAAFVAQCRRFQKENTGRRGK